MTCTHVASLLISTVHIVSKELVCEIRDESGGRNLQYSKRIRVMLLSSSIPLDSQRYLLSKMHGS